MIVKVFVGEHDHAITATAEAEKRLHDFLADNRHLELVQLSTDLQCGLGHWVFTITGMFGRR